jgi:hypothetical protein
MEISSIECSCEVDFYFHYNPADRGQGGLRRTLGVTIHVLSLIRKYSKEWRTIDVLF